MRITSNCKKMMAVVIAITMVLSVLFIPKPQQASAAAPTVTVLGATLRLNSTDNKGTQSMRIGIRVNNAGSAGECAITLAANGRRYTVATFSTEDKLKDGNGDTFPVNLTNRSIHSKEGNSIIYAIVLTGIPAERFSSNIDITGNVWDLSKNYCAPATPMRHVTCSVTSTRSCTMR